MLLYNQLLYQNLPDVSSVLSSRSKLIGKSALFGTGSDLYLPSKDLVQAAAALVDPLKTDLAVLNIEHWPLPSSIWNYVAVVEWFREALNPAVKIGYYGMVPKRDYWRALKPAAHADFIAWQQENNQLAPLVNAVDILCPSIYTFYPDRAGWVTYAIANLDEAFRIGNGKPVYPYIWPQYHDSNATLGLQHLTGSYWRQQLDTLKTRPIAGAIVWGGWQQPWKADACWWGETVEFAATL